MVGAQRSLQSWSCMAVVHHGAGGKLPRGAVAAGRTANQPTDQSTDQPPSGKPMWKLVLEQFDDMLVKVRPANACGRPAAAHADSRRPPCASRAGQLGRPNSTRIRMHVSSLKPPAALPPPPPDPLDPAAGGAGVLRHRLFRGGRRRGDPRLHRAAGDPGHPGAQRDRGRVAGAVARSACVRTAADDNGGCILMRAAAVGRRRLSRAAAWSVKQTPSIGTQPLHHSSNCQRPRPGVQCRARPGGPEGAAERDGARHTRRQDGGRMAGR
jgi:hypothetical protein